MAALNLPSLPSSGLGASGSFGTAGIFGGAPGGNSESRSSSVSASRPVLLRPDADTTQQGFNTLQSGVELNNPQQAAVGVQRSLGQTLKDLLAGGQSSGEQRINEGFQRASGSATDDLIRRGLDPRLVQQTSQAGQDRESGLAVGDLTDALLNRDVATQTQVSGNIADLLFGSSEQATDLINALLGSSAIGNIRQSQSQSASSGINTAR